MPTSETGRQDSPVQNGVRGEDQAVVPEVLPVLPVRDIVTFPFMIVPLLITEPRSIAAVDQALSLNRMILTVTQKARDVDHPVPSDLYDVGTAGMVIRMMKMAEDKVRVLVQGMARARVKEWRSDLACLQANIQVIEETAPEIGGLQLEALSRNVLAAIEKAASLGKNISQEIMVIAANTTEPGRLADLAASNISLSLDEAQEILTIPDPSIRLRRVHELLTREIEILTVQERISSQAKDEIDKMNRDYYLRQQLKAIQAELGQGSEIGEEVGRYIEKADEAGLPEEAREEFDRQVRKLERMNPESAETATLRNYLDCVVSLPWSRETKDNLDLRRARKILEEDHHGLERVKTRILEHLAVRRLKEDSKGPILCLVGPPGTGKTSLGRSIARALGRNFVRMSLGGVHDEAEIRGHRRTYVGALPGRIIQGLQQAGSRNPVFMMDEVDKLGSDFRGDPSSALLEVLDPEQNNSFRDNYLGVAFDLSRVLFITTANVLYTIQPAFRDRLEMIPLSGYSEAEKVQIARKHLIPRQLHSHGLRRKDIVLSDKLLRDLIQAYTREAGLRNLEREIAAICRKTATRFALGNRRPVEVTSSLLTKWLGPPKFLPEDQLRADQVGVATGLAWTPVGGDILHIETQAMTGKGGMMLTGQLGEVMKESAHAALSYARAHAADYGIPEDFFAKHDFHIHIPEGAIPKDGPSAGITLAAALISACTRRPVRRTIAMTGEITLRGDVLPVGGIKEKVLAAHRARLRSVILPGRNRKDVQEVPQELRRKLKIQYADRMEQVLRRVLV